MMKQLRSAVAMICAVSVVVSAPAPAGARTYRDRDDAVTPLDIKTVKLESEERAVRITLSTYEGWKPTIFHLPDPTPPYSPILIKLNHEDADVMRRADRSCAGSGGGFWCYSIWFEYRRGQGKGLKAVIQRGSGQTRDGEPEWNYRIIARVPAYKPTRKSITFVLTKKVFPLRPGTVRWRVQTQYCSLRFARFGACMDFIPQRDFWGTWRFVPITRRVATRAYTAAVVPRSLSQCGGGPIPSEAPGNCLVFPTFKDYTTSYDKFVTFSYDQQLCYGTVAAEQCPSEANLPLPPLVRAWQDRDQDGEVEKLAVLCGERSWDKPLRITPGVPLIVTVGDEATGDPQAMPPGCTVGTNGTVTAIFGSIPEASLPRPETDDGDALRRSDSSLAYVE